MKNVLKFVIFLIFIHNFLLIPINTDHSESSLDLSGEELNQRMQAKASQVKKKIYKHFKRIVFRLHTLQLSLDKDRKLTSEIAYALYSKQLKNLESQAEVLLASFEKILDNLPPVDSSECSQINECSDCVRNIKCGWCWIEKKCVLGDNISPLNIDCAIYDYQICKSLPCGVHRTCGLCTADQHCGWCINEKLFQENCFSIEEKRCPQRDFYQCGGRECSTISQEQQEEYLQRETEKAKIKAKRQAKGLELLQFEKQFLEKQENLRSIVFELRNLEVEMKLLRQQKQKIEKSMNYDKNAEITGIWLVNPIIEQDGEKYFEQPEGEAEGEAEGEDESDLFGEIFGKILRFFGDLLNIFE